MVSVTLAVPKELKKEMDSFPEINWSAVAREAIQRKITLLHRFEAFSKESAITDEDAVRVGRAVNKRLAKHYSYGSRH